MVASSWLSICLLCLTVVFQAVTSDNVPFFTAEQLSDYDRDGFLVVSNIFSATDLDRLMVAGDAMVAAAADSSNKTFSVMAEGVLFENQNATDHSTLTNAGDDSSSSCSASSDTLATSNAFRQIAVHSVLGQACAELLRLDPDNKYDNLRILRDVFLAKPVHTSRECDWHVDDQAFWPESHCSETTTTITTTGSSPTTNTKNNGDGSSSEQHEDEDEYAEEHDTYTTTDVCANGEPSDRGVNVWIAMDDMPLATLGSMALARGSHKAVWRHDAYRAIGQDRSVPGGGGDRDELVKRFTDGISNNTTCSMPDSDPELRQQIEDTAVFLDIRKGDVIFANRLLFHRTLAVTDAGKVAYDSEHRTNLNRYSIRFVPGAARLPAGFNLELSILDDPANAGRTLDEVVSAAGLEWYPQVWPTLEPDVDAKLDDLASGPMMLATKKKKVEFKKFMLAVAAARKLQENP
jgi:hypothetical protein